MEIGISSRCLPAKNLNTEDLTEFGIDAVEVNTGSTPLRIKPKYWKILQQISDDYVFSIHPHLFPFSQMSGFLQEHAQEIISFSAECLSRLDGDYLVVHVKGHEGAERLEKFLEKAPGNIQVVLENNNKNYPATFKQTAELARKLGVKMNLDLGHLNIVSDNPLKEIDEYGATDIVEYMHLHTNNGRKDQHLALGEAKPSLEEIAQAIDVCEPEVCVIENRERKEAEKSLKLLKQIL